LPCCCATASRVRDQWPLPSLEGSADEVDLLFYPSLVDRRACWAPGGVGLSDPNGWAVAGPDGIRWWKDAALVEELDRLHSEWLARGRPSVQDHKVAFVPIGEDAAPLPGGWVLDRRFFRELIWLDEP
jgi:hypothetical protein